MIHLMGRVHDEMSSPNLWGPEGNITPQRPTEKNEMQNNSDASLSDKKNAPITVAIVRMRIKMSIARMFDVAPASRWRF